MGISNDFCLICGAAETERLAAIETVGSRIISCGTMEETAFLHCKCGCKIYMLYSLKIQAHILSDNVHI